MINCVKIVTRFGVQIILFIATFANKMNHISLPSSNNNNPNSLISIQTDFVENNIRHDELSYNKLNTGVQNIGTTSNIFIKKRKRFIHEIYQTKDYPYRNKITLNKVILFRREYFKSRLDRCRDYEHYVGRIENSIIKIYSNHTISKSTDCAKIYYVLINKRKIIANSINYPNQCSKFESNAELSYCEKIILIYDCLSQNNIEIIYDKKYQETIKQYFSLSEICHANATNLILFSKQINNIMPKNDSCIYTSNKICDQFIHLFVCFMNKYKTELLSSYFDHNNQFASFENSFNSLIKIYDEEKSKIHESSQMFNILNKIDIWYGFLNNSKNCKIVIEEYNRKRMDVIKSLVGAISFNQYTNAVEIYNEFLNIADEKDETDVIKLVLEKIMSNEVNIAYNDKLSYSFQFLGNLKVNNGKYDILKKYVNRIFLKTEKENSTIKLFFKCFYKESLGYKYNTFVWYLNSLSRQYNDFNYWPNYPIESIAKDYFRFIPKDENYTEICLCQIKYIIEKLYLTIAYIPRIIEFLDMLETVYLIKEGYKYLCSIARDKDNFTGYQSVFLVNKAIKVIGDEFDYYPKEMKYLFNHASFEMSVANFRNLSKSWDNLSEKEHNYKFEQIDDSSHFRIMSNNEYICIDFAKDSNGEIHTLKDLKQGCYCIWLVIPLVHNNKHLFNFKSMCGNLKDTGFYLGLYNKSDSGFISRHYDDLMTRNVEHITWAIKVSD